MSAQGDALRASATALRAAVPAAQSLRDWFTYFKQPVFADAYSIVANRAAQDADLLDALAQAVDAQSPPAATTEISYRTGYSGEG